MPRRGARRLLSLVAKSSGYGSALRWRWLAAVAAALAVFHFSPLGGTLDRAFLDAASRHPLRAARPPAGSALVLIDRATMDALSQRGWGTWPPPRGAFAGLIAGLERAGARRIVMDFVFLDHSAAAEQDTLLGAVAAGLPQVVLACTAHPRQMPVFWDDSFVAAHRLLFESPRTGAVDDLPDRDGVIRRYAVPGSLAEAAVGRPVAAGGGLLRWYGGLEQLRAANVPVLSAARFIVAGLPMVARAAEAAPDLEPETLARAVAREPALTGPGFDDVRGRIVFVGGNTASTFDQKAFAIGGLEPGVLHHWTAWADLAGGGFIRELPGWPVWLVAAAIVALVTWAGAGRRSLLGAASAALAAAAGVAAVSYAGLSAGWFFGPATPVAAAGLALLGITAENFWIERRRRQEVQSMFGSYVDPGIVEELVRNPSAIRLGGERREATVFFCDLAGFTDLSEQVSPEQLFELVNGYLDETSECLLAHGAYIDKYIGDAVMAVFGAPKLLPNHAVAACRAALAAQRLLAARNVRLAATFGRQLGMRIGIHSGEMIVGNLGSERKRNYTAIGDGVNLASRLEGANKEFGTAILLSESTVRLLDGQLVVRPLTALRVKGKQTAVSVYELVGDAGELTPAQNEFLEAYGAGHALYVARRFDEAAVALARAAALVPGDRMTQTLLADSRQLAELPPSADWQPVLTLKTK